MKGSLPAVFTAVVLATTLQSVAAQPPAPEPPPVPFAVAIVDAAGVVEPIARFDGASWERIWDEPAPKAQPPATLDQIPAAWFPPDGRLPSAWFLWLVNDPRAISAPFEERAGLPIGVTDAVVLRIGCTERVVLASAYRAAPMPDGDAHRVKAGVALTENAIRVEQPTVLSPDSPLVTTITERALSAFHRAEEDQLELLEPPARKDVPSFAARRALPVKWTRAVRLGVAQAPRRTYYLEGETAYGAIVMTGHVWVQIDRERDTLDAEVALTDPGRKEVRVRTPLGVLRAGERRFWVFEVKVWEHAFYEIVEASGQGGRPATVVEAQAGGC